MNKTGIPWCDLSWNLWTGCLHGCSYCYAKGIATHFSRANKGGEQFIWGRHTVATRHTQSGSCTVYTAKDDSPPFPMGWAPTYYPLRETEPLSLRKSGQRIFAESMADPFGDWVRRSWLVKLFGVMAAVPDETFILLTKDPARAAEWLNDPTTPEYVEEAAAEHTHGYQGEWPLPNVWLLTSIEDQPAADERVPDLLRCKAAVRGVSVEPMLGPISLDHMDIEAAGDREWCFINALNGRQTDMGRPCPDVPHLNWVIAGGETGPGARPVHPDWLRGLRDQCVKAKVPFFFKGWGQWIPCEDGQLPGANVHPSGGWPYPNKPDGGIGVARMVKLHRTRSNHLLDGQEWRQFPEVRNG